jgi:hypothetical protein
MNDESQKTFGRRLAAIRKPCKIYNALVQKDNVATREVILRLELRTTVLWLVTILVIIATNPRIIDFIGKV